MQRCAYEVYEAPNSDRYFDWRTIPIKDLDKELYLDKHTYFLTALQAIDECRRRNELVMEFRRNTLHADKVLMSGDMLEFKWKLYTNTDNSTQTDTETINTLKQEVKDWKAEADSFEKQLQSKYEQNEDLIQEISYLDRLLEDKREHAMGECSEPPISSSNIYEVFYAVYDNDNLLVPVARGWSRVTMSERFSYESYCKSLEYKYRVPNKYIEIISVTQLN